MRKRPSQGRSRVTVTSILEAADRILRTDGYEAASTNRVARVAGFSVGSLYQYFRDKQAIVGALIDRDLSVEAEQINGALDQPTRRTPGELAGEAFGLMLTRRVARMHLYRTLDAHAPELGAGPLLEHLCAAQAPVLAETLHRVCAQVLPRSSRSIDARMFVLSRLATSVSFAYAVDAPAGVAQASLRDEFASAIERFLDGKPPGPSAVTLVVGWAKGVGVATPLAEQRGRRRREARGVLLARGVAADLLEPRAFLLAGIAEVALAAQNSPHGATPEDLLHEASRFVEALEA
ncbi:MAG TPA: TetR/AcrR family transcriptional regulator [Myxococcota bacterium]